VKEQEKANKAAGQWAWFAERDARMRSVVNSTNFTDAQKIKAERVKLALGLVYTAEQFYIEYRKKFISVKVHKPEVIDTKGLEQLEAIYQAEGLVKIKTAQGVTYRIIKA
jgi:hypothetical protein